MNLSEIREHVIAGNLEVLIGLLENERFDVKSMPYEIGSENGKMELAKDISSFANKDGGIIVLGAKTAEGDDSVFGRKVEAIRPFAINLVSTSDYHRIIKDWIYPKPDGIEIDWKAAANTPDKGIVYIYIPPQVETLRPFLIRKDIDPQTNRKRKEILFGYVERVFDSSDPVTIEVLHLTLRLGKENRETKEMKSLLEQVLSGVHASAPEGSERKKKLDELIWNRVQFATESSGLSKFRSYGIVISPIEEVEVTTLLSSSPESIGKVMENPEQLRDAGWGLETDTRSQLVGGELRRVKNDQYKILDVYRDGTMIFCCRADSTFLGFGNHFGDTKLNPLALVEPTYLSFKFYESVLGDIQPVPRALRVMVSFNNLHLNEQKTTLAPGDVFHQLDYMSDRHRREAPEDRFLAVKTISTEGYDPSVAAFLMIREIYAWFGIEEDKIPYSKEKVAVDIGKIVNSKK